MNSISRNWIDWKPLGRREQRPEDQEVLRRHRLDHVDLRDQQPLDHVHPAEQLAREVGVAGEHVVASPLQLVQHLLEPQLVGLVDRDEQQLVVRRRVDFSCCCDSSSGRCR
jgi:hypothetical protein